MRTNRLCSVNYSFLNNFFIMHIINRFNQLTICCIYTGLFFSAWKVVIETFSSITYWIVRWMILFSKEEWMWWCFNFKNLQACGWMDGYQVPPPSVETRCFPYFLTNDHMNCSSAISMHASFIIRCAYVFPKIVLSFSSIAIHHTHTQTNDSVPTLIIYMTAAASPVQSYIRPVQPWFCAAAISLCSHSVPRRPL